MKLSERDLSTIRNKIMDRIKPWLIIIFGSAAQGRLTARSDIDIAFLSEQNIDPFEVFQLAQEISAELSRDVDLVDLSQASTVFQAIVFSTGQVLYCSDPARRQKLHALTLKKYARLNEERQVVLKKLFPHLNQPVHEH